VSDLLDVLMRAATGKTSDELAGAGRAAYPQESTAHNRQAHRLAAKLMSQRVGFIPAQIAGLGMEALEGGAQAAAGLNPFRLENLRESAGDIGANLRGAGDAFREGLFGAR